MNKKMENYSKETQAYLRADMIEGDMVKWMMEHPELQELPLEARMNEYTKAAEKKR